VEIKSTQEAMGTSSTEMAALTSALVRWTRLSVVAIIIYTLLTGIMVWVQVVGLPARMPSTSAPHSQLSASPVLAFGDPGERRWRFDEYFVEVTKSRKGRLSSQVEFDRAGALRAIRGNAPPVP
jgi:hypothetical protein